VKAVAFACISFIFGSAAAQIQERALEVDFSKITGLLRPLHGLNQGPLAPGGLIDLTPEFRALRPPIIRLHDCH
jgi:hypothetical protein